MPKTLLKYLAFNKKVKLNDLEMGQCLHAQRKDVYQTIDWCDIHKSSNAELGQVMHQFESSCDMKYVRPHLIKLKKSVVIPAQYYELKSAFVFYGTSFVKGHQICFQDLPMCHDRLLFAQSRDALSYSVLTCKQESDVCSVVVCRVFYYEHEMSTPSVFRISDFRRVIPLYLIVFQINL
jgi:hypothetical protein